MAPVEVGAALVISGDAATLAAISTLTGWALRGSTRAVMVRSVPEILDVERFGRSEGPVDLVIEVPHGAEPEDYEALATELEGPHPEGLIEFFHVNTDIGASALARALAARLTAEHDAAVSLLRCRVPRTFVDTNRRLDPRPEGPVPSALGGRVTPGMMPWVTSPADERLLVERHARYLAEVEVVLSAMPRAALLLLHSYAPRSVDVEVTESIVTDLRAAYRPETVETWPLRPALDVIHRLPEGNSLAPPGFVDGMQQAFEGVEEVGDNLTYPLHPVTVAHAHATRWPGRVMCVEVRRDLLADPFVPLQPCTIGASKVARLADPFARALSAVLPAGR